MVSVSKVDDSYHEECLWMLNEGIRCAISGDKSIITCINRSGYQVLTTADAVRLLTDFRDIYLHEFAHVKHSIF